MIAAKLGDFPFDVATRDRVRRALAWLKATDMTALAPGRHEIEGNAIYANVMQVTTSSPSSKAFEAHHRYIDIHYVIEGQELIGVAPVGECPVCKPYDERDEYLLCTDPVEPARVSWVLLRAGEFCVTPPADAHKPACCAGEPAPLRKACVKVLVG